ncbi:hypothetical protein SEA_LEEROYJENKINS_121 [Microbacterium phage LeeroyJenkins]|nr:hypothetical protein SEA_LEEROYJENKINS_121 [Microbacterium phage LeeroyJenkins]QOC59436.1 hypothetical protein SEA_LIFES_115 [Microbacterium phage Lifes]
MFYVWIDNLIEPREAMTLYPTLQGAIDVAVMFENDGHSVQVRNARTGQLAYE